MVKEPRVRRVLKIANKQQAPVVCGKCLTPFRHERRWWVENTNSTLFVQNVIQNQDFKSIGEALQQLNQEIDLANDQVSTAIAKARIANGRKEKYEGLRRQMLELVKVYPSVAYQVRRSEANYYISKPEIRLVIFNRDGFICKECGGVDRLSIDHIIPVISGGTDSHCNLQTLCVPCNSKKGRNSD